MESDITPADRSPQGFATSEFPRAGTSLRVTCFDAGGAHTDNWDVTDVDDETITCATAYALAELGPRPNDAVIVSYVTARSSTNIETTVLAANPGAITLGWPRRGDLRRFARISIDAGITLAVPDDIVVAARTLDVGAGGVRVLSGESMLAGTTVLVAFDLGSGPVTAVGKVLNCAPAGFESELRIVFTKISLEHQEIVGEWVTSAAAYVAARHEARRT